MIIRTGNSYETKENELFIKNRICDELKKINYNFAYIGTKYLVKVIYIIVVQNKKYNCKFEKEIYPLIENKYGNSINNIKCSIAYATDKMFYDCDEKILKNYIGEFYYSQPKPKTIAFVIKEKVIESYK